MRVPYKEIAFFALTKWNGVSEEEATKMINLLTVDELDSHVWAKGSVNHAIDSIAQILKLSEEDKKAFSEAVYNGPVDAPIFAKVGELIANVEEKELFVIHVLSDIHDGWVKDNSSEKTFNKKKDKKQLRQYAPLPIIGFNEAKSDLIFLKPILAACGLDTDKLLLEGAYHHILYQFLLENGITSMEELEQRIALGELFYSALPSELAERLKPLAKEIAQQIYENWEANDKVSAITFLQVQKESLISKKELNEYVLKNSDYDKDMVNNIDKLPNNGNYDNFNKKF